MTDEIYAKAVVEQVYRGVIKTIREVEAIAAVRQMTGQQALSLIADKLEAALEETAV